MNTKSIIEIFRGDDSDALGYQTIVGTIHTDLDLTGCKAVFRYLGFFQEFDPIPEDGKLTIVIPSASSMQFPPGFGYASLKVYDIDRKVRTFTNRIPVFVKTMTPCRGGGEFDVEFSPFPELEPLKIFIGPNADDFDQYTGFLTKTIDRASLAKYGLVMLADAMSEDGGDSGKAASPAAVRAAYDAIIGVLADNYYTAEQTEEAIDRVAAYYITRNAAGDAFETKAQLDNATVFYSGGEVRVPTRNDYCVVLADETHQGAEYRYIYAVAEGQTTGSWQPQFPVEGVMTVDQTVTKNSTNPVAGGGVWSALWGALSALPTGFSSLYDWCVAQLAGKLDKSGGTMTGPLTIVRSGDNIKIDGSTIRFNDEYGNPTGGTISGTDGGGNVTLPTSSGTIALVSDIPAVVAPSTSSSASGKTADAKATGDALALKASDNAVVKLTGDQDIGGNKTFYGDVAIADGKDLNVYGGRVAVRSQGGSDVALFEYDRLEYSTDGGMTWTSIMLDNIAPLASPAFTGTPTTPTPSSGDDSTKVANTAFVQGAIPYSLVTKTISNGAVSLDDRASNAVTISATLSPNTLTINFPTATTGKLRDFAMRLNIAAGVTAPEIAWPQGVTLENNGGEVPEISDGGTGGSSTILYFSETENDGTTAKFLVKGETLTAIAQA